STLLLPGCEDFDVGPAHIDGKHAHEIKPPDRRRHTPFRARPQAALASAALLEAITPRSSFHEATNDFAPSSCSFAASVSMSTPAFPKAASTFSHSPPSALNSEPSSP